VVGSWHHGSGVGAAQGIRWTAVYTLCIVGTAVPTLWGTSQATGFTRRVLGSVRAGSTAVLNRQPHQDCLIAQGMVTSKVQWAGWTVQRGSISNQACESQ